MVTKISMQLKFHLEFLESFHRYGLELDIYIYDKRVFLGHPGSLILVKCLLGFVNQAKLSFWDS